MSEEEILLALNWLAGSRLLAWPDQEFCDELIEHGFDEGSEMQDFMDAADGCEPLRVTQMERANDLIRSFQFQLLEAGKI